MWVGLTFISSIIDFGGLYFRFSPCDLIQGFSWVRTYMKTWKQDYSEKHDVCFVTDFFFRRALYHKALNQIYLDLVAFLYSNFTLTQKKIVPALPCS